MNDEGRMTNDESRRGALRRFALVLAVVFIIRLPALPITITSTAANKFRYPASRESWARHSVTELNCHGTWTPTMPTLRCNNLRHSSFGLRASFVIRHSSFVIF